MFIKVTLVLSSLFILNPMAILNKVNSEPDKYERLWQKVDNFEQDALPQSALQTVDSIFQYAVTDGNEAQIVKSTIYRLKYTSLLEEDGFENSIVNLETQVLKQEGIPKAMMHLLLATMYSTYYSNNYYLINQRSVTFNFELNDLKTWDKTRFQDQIIKNYNLAMDNSLKEAELDDYVDIIDYAKESHVLFPTLYDFVAYTASSALSNNYYYYYYYGYASPQSDNITESAYLNNVSDFVKLPIDADSLSYNYTAIKIYQNWLKFRLSDTENLEALIYTDIKRLSFVRNNLASSNKDSLWESNIFNQLEKYRKNPESTMLVFELANSYYLLGSSYVYTDSTKLKYKNYNIKAVALLDDVLKLFPESCYSPECKNLKDLIEREYYSFETENIVSPNKAFPIRISYHNTEKVYMTILYCDYDKYLDTDQYYYDDTNFKELLKISKKVVDAKLIELPKTTDLNNHTTEYLVDGLEKGFYAIFLHSKPNFTVNKNYLAYADLFVSDISLTYNEDYYENSGYYVFDRNTGKPIVNAKVDAYINEYSYIKRKYVYNKITTEFTDKNGFVALTKTNKDDYYDLRIDASKDGNFVSENTYNYDYYDYEDEVETVINFFTDRAIYRPGQQINFKGICIDQKGENNKIKPNYSTRVSLYDVNYQELAFFDVKTNEYGSFSETFDIPLGVLTGNFTISCDEGSQYVRVEEYKRPMFEIEMLPIEGEYRINDSVYAEGTAMSYAGTPLTDTKVKYTINRNPLWWGYYRGGSFTQKEIAFGETDIDDNGKFKIGFKAIAEDFGEMNDYVYYFYTVNVSVTDLSGETQTNSTMVYVSNKGLVLSQNLYNTILRENLDSIEIYSNNVSGNFVPANVEIKIYKLKDPNILLAEMPWASVNKKMYTKEEWYKAYPGYEYADESNYSTWQSGEKVFAKLVNTGNNKKAELTNVKKWDSGAYRVVLKSKDKWGNKIENSSEFVLYSTDSDKMPYTATSFFASDKVFASPGETVSLFVGSSYKDVYVLYELEVKGKPLKKEIIKLNSQVKKIDILIHESHRGGISANFMFIKDGRIYSYCNNISVGWDNKELDLEFITFRDKTLPGSKEEWKIKITDNTGNPAGAEFLASMYDASLDAFAKNSWYWSILPYYSSYSNWAQTSFSYSSSNQTYDNFYPAGVSKNVYSPNLKMFGFYYQNSNYYDYYDNDRNGNYYGVINTATGASQVMMDQTVVFKSMTKEKNGEALMPEMDIAGKADYFTSVTDKKQSEDSRLVTRGAGKIGDPNVQIRKNFNETAFFYPNLVTDANGEILISFTMPESLTRWNFMGFAHTKDLKMGQISKELVTQKELMVMPNLPRFFRENDKMTLSTKINNVSEDIIEGTATIEFFDPVTQNNLNSLFLGRKSNEQKISIEKGKNIAINWDVAIPEGLSAVGVRIVAVGKKHSDGEEKVIPILTNRMLVTETMPLPVHKAGTTSFTMKKLKINKSTTLKHYKYTLEFTNNPAWYAVQALPYIMEYPYECAEQTFSRYYANILATHIANSDPKIKRVFDIWKNTPSSDALLSNLDKNQELKALLLEETPWVLEAQDENERKHRIGLLFDLNRMSNESSAALKKLEDQQKYNGGWAWFKGMPESWYITQYIVCGLGHLDNLGVTEVKSNNKTWNMTTKAIKFIDGEMAQSYKDLNKYCDADCLAKDHIDYMQIQYLYARSYFIDEVPIDKKTQEAFDYYKRQAQKYWKNKSFYMQGMISLALYRYDDKIIPAKIVASLKEYAIHNDEMGMYWKSDRGYYWYQAPIETQALLIEMFDEVANDQESVEEMKVWLLKQKQTQDWKTTTATAEAIYALLLRGTNLLSDDSMATIQIGNMKIDPTNDPEIKTEAGTGYFKKSWDGSQVLPSWGDVKVTKTSNTVSWGAVYWQYFEQLDKITEFEETPLTINKKLFVERRVGVKPVIVPLEKDANLIVGDKVTVRIEIRVDRDMEYVHLKDMRASCFEPVDYLSGYRYSAGLGYYQAIKDASMNFFIDYLRKGTYVFEYELIVAQKGDFSNGITTMQCMYAPEFTSHSEGVRVQVK